MRFKNQDRLSKLLEEKRPDVLKLIGPMQYSEILPILNKITGCNVKGTDTIEKGMAIYIKALEKCKVIIT